MYPAYLLREKALEANASRTSDLIDIFRAGFINIKELYQGYEEIILNANFKNKKGAKNNETTCN